MSGDVTLQAQNAFKGKPEPKNKKPAKRYPTPISVRFTDEERALLEDKAGDLTLSAYVRLYRLYAPYANDRPWSLF